ncbi:MAG: hypothetical protein AB7O88_09260 [Reyranellaceae bacterium]
MVDAQRSSRWPIFLFVAAVVLAIGGGIAYEEYAANAPIVLTPKPSPPPTTTAPPGGRASQPLNPSSRPTQPSQSRPRPSTADTMEWLPLVIGLIPIVFIGVIVLVIVSFVRRRMRQAMLTQTGGANPVGHWVGGQHQGPGTTAAGPWARNPGAAASTVTTTTAPSSQPVKRKGGGFPLLPIIVGAIILDQAAFHGRYSREVLAWITKFIEGFSR